MQGNKHRAMKTRQENAAKILERLGRQALMGKDDEPMNQNQINAANSYLDRVSGYQKLKLTENKTELTLKQFTLVKNGTDTPQGTDGDS